MMFERRSIISSLKVGASTSSRLAVLLGNAIRRVFVTLQSLTSWLKVSWKCTLDNDCIPLTSFIVALCSNQLLFIV